MTIKSKIILAFLALLCVPVLMVVGLLAWLHALDRSSGTVTYLDEEHPYLLHVPHSYDSTRPAPLVISIHGSNLWPAQQMNMTGWNRLADEHGFIVAYPSGTGTPRTWETKLGILLMVDDESISRLIDKLQATYNIDRKRIYVNGFGDGAGIAFALSCTQSDRIAAIGMVAGAESFPESWCPDGQPVPVIAFHGTADRIVPYEGGRSQVVPGRFPSTRTWMASMARRNRCADTPGESPIAEGVTRLEYTDCADDATVDLYRISGGGHTWPGGKPLPGWIFGPTTSRIDATALMWTFFSEHPFQRLQLTDEPILPDPFSPCPTTPEQ